MGESFDELTTLFLGYISRILRIWSKHCQTCCVPIHSLSLIATPEDQSTLLCPLSANPERPLRSDNQSLQSDFPILNLLEQSRILRASQEAPLSFAH